MREYYAVMRTNELYCSCSNMDEFYKCNIEHKKQTQKNT